LLHKPLDGLATEIQNQIVDGARGVFQHNEAQTHQ
jgi:hypothetical protein